MIFLTMALAAMLSACDVDSATPTDKPDTPVVNPDKPATPDMPTDPESPDRPDTPGTDEPTNPDTPTDPEAPTDPDSPTDPDKQATGSLIADGDDANTYKLILDSGYNYETPDNSGDHALAPFRHITQSYDETLGKYVFNFILHIDNDDDRGLANITDRQRNEIKTDGKSPKSMVAAEGESLRMTWKFRLPDGMVTTNKFAHIHQLKGIDNKDKDADVSMPLITFTVRTLSNGKQQLHVIFNGPSDEGPKNEYLGRADLELFKGNWVEATETVNFSKDGSYELVIRRLSDSRELLRISRSGLNFWRSGSTGMRPKWGLYRSFGTGGSLKPEMRDETLQFADFMIEKL